MARGLYTLPFSNLTLANQAVTLGFINPGTTATIKIRRLSVTQSANATSAQQRVQWNTQVTAFPTLTSQAPIKTATLDGSSVITGATNGAAGTSGINASAEGGGTKTIIYPDNFNVLNGHLYVPTPDEVVIMSAGGSSGFGYHFPAAPAALTAWSGAITFEEC